MIKLKRINIYCDVEFTGRAALEEFKKELSRHMAGKLGTKPVIYHTFETKDDNTTNN